MLSMPRAWYRLRDDIIHEYTLLDGTAHLLIVYEPAHDKTYNKTCVTSKGSDQPVHPPRMARVLVHPSLNSPEAVEGACDQRRL